MMKTQWLLFLIMILFNLNFSPLVAQEQLKLQSFEDSLQSKFTALISAKFDADRMQINKNIEGLFDELLSIKESFDYPFEKLKNISKLSAEDGMVRILNWNLPKEDGTYVYYAYILHFDKKSDNFKLYKLNDMSEVIENPEHKKLDQNNWYGALYYQILINQEGMNTYYTLLGWDGNDNFSNKKIIECFFFENEKLILGPPVFKMDEDIQNRLIFEFAKQTKMMLRFDDKINMIVYDHLAPSHKKFEGQFMYYGPDMSQDGIKFTDGYWLLKPNLDLRNMEESTGKSIKKSF